MPPHEALPPESGVPMAGGAIRRIPPRSPDNGADAPAMETPAGPTKDHTILDQWATSGETTTGLPEGERSDHGTTTEPCLPQIPGYQIVKRLGGGGMGEVFEAINRLGRRFALKIIRPDRADAQFRARFRQEAAVLQDLDHSHIARIFEYSEAGEVAYFTMRLLNGGTLAERMADGRFHVRECVALMADIADAVGFLHNRSLLHRDLKPTNILFDEEGRPYISDFGLVKELGAHIARGGSDGPEVLLDTTKDAESPNEAPLTAAGNVPGTMRYMAPEQLHGELDLIRAWSDVWALGTIAYELLTGHRPFGGDSTGLLLQQIETTPPIAPSAFNSEVDPDLDQIILRCLAKAPDDRFVSAAPLAKELQAWLRSGATPIAAEAAVVQQPKRKVAKPLLLASLVVVVALGLAGFLFLRGDPERQVRDLLHQLAQGRKVELIGDAGMPKHHRILTGEGTNAWLDKNGIFNVDSRWPGLVELLPDPGIERYRFRVWVRQNIWFGRPARAGIYCLHRHLGQATQHGFVELSVAEDDVDAKDSGVLELTDPKNRITSLACFLRMVEERKSNDNRPIRDMTFETTPPADDKTETWRELILEVTPERVTARFGDKETASIDRQRVEHGISSLIKGRGLPAPNPAHGGGLGLLVFGGSASFRLAAVEPLLPQNP